MAALLVYQTLQRYADRSGHPPNAVAWILDAV